MKKLIAAILSVLVLSGCAQLPRTSAIGIGPEIKSNDSTDYVYYSPATPSSGDSPQDIVSGFLAAGTGPQNDYAIAREYLNIDTQATWSPNDEVLIQDGTPNYTWLSETEVAVDVKISASISAGGTYTSLPSGSMRRLNYKVEKESGEWRIVEAPNLTILIHPNFQVLFKPYSVFFFDSDHRYLIPDVRWFPSRSSTATHLVKAQLAGAQDWMKPALASVPDGLFVLNTNAVTVTDGIANIDLADSAVKATSQQLRFLKAELKATLLQLPQVTGVAISIARTLQDVSDVPARITSSTSADPLVLTADGISVLGKTEFVFSKRQISKIVSAPIIDFATNSNVNSVALQTSSGIYVGRTSSLGLEHDFVDGREKLLPPRWDNRDFVWTVTSRTNGSWFASDAESTRLIVTRGLTGSAVTSFEISPDGARVLMVLKGKRNGLWLASIVRDSEGRPSQLGELFNVFVNEGEPAAASWADATHLGILLKSANNESRPVMLMLGGEKNTYPAIDSAVSVLGSLNGPVLYVFKSDDTVVRARGSVWSLVQSYVKAVHYPGH